MSTAEGQQASSAGNDDPGRQQAPTQASVGLDVQLEVALPDFLHSLERGRLGRAIDVVSRSRTKAISIIRDGGSKRLLGKLVARIETARESLQDTRAGIMSRLRSDDERVNLVEGLLHPLLGLVEKILDSAVEYLEEHAGEETMSQLDSVDSEFEKLLQSLVDPGSIAGHLRQQLFKQEAEQQRLIDEVDHARRKQHAEQQEQVVNNNDMKQQVGKQWIPEPPPPPQEDPDDQPDDAADLDRRLHRLRMQGIPPREMPYIRQPVVKPETGDDRSHDFQEHHREDQHQKVKSMADAQIAAFAKVSDCLELMTARAEVPPAPVESFKGDPADYMYFMKNFEDRVESRPFSEATKLAQLIEACQGKVKTEIASFKGQARGFEKARDYLAYHYGQPQQIVDCTIQRLTVGSEIRGNDVEGLKSYSRAVETAYDLLEEMDLMCEADTQSILKAIFNRLPHRLRTKWVEKVCDMEAKKRRPKFVHLKDFIVAQTKKSCHPVFQVTQPRQSSPPKENQSRRNDNVVNKSRPYHQESGRYQRRYFGPENHTAYHARPAAPPIPPIYPVVYTGQPGAYYQPQYSHPVSYPPRQQSGSGTTSHTQQAQSENCSFCKRTGHDIISCPAFELKPAVERKKFVQEQRLCYSCLKPHRRDTCPKRDVKCTMKGCNGLHQRLIHIDRSSTQESATSKVEVQSDTSVVLLRIVPVRIFGENGSSATTYAMLDGGSTCSIIKKGFADKLGIVGTPSNIRLNTVTRRESERISLSKCRVSSIASDNGYEIPRLHIMQQIHLAGQLETRGNVSSKYSHLRGIKFQCDVDVPEVSLLIGEDVPTAHRILEYRFGKNEDSEPYAVRTPLGWYVAGPTSSAAAAESIESGHICLHTEAEQTLDPDLASLKRDVDRLWNEERHTFGNGPERTLSVEDKVALQSMQDSVKLVNGHYSVGMLWKNPNVKLPSNLAVARKCLASVRQQMMRRPLFSTKYRAMVENYIAKGYAAKMSPEEAATTSDKTWYLPHHGVESAHKPDKVRVVFNAASICNKVSLNGQLMHGPDLNSNLVGCIMRFRMGPVALNADIEEMYHQVLVPPQDSEALRFLWYETDTATTPSYFRMTRHVFGAKDSPTTCVFALHQCAKDHRDQFDRITSETVWNNFYVDDLLRAVQSEDDGMRLANQLIDMLEKGGFKLMKFISNRPEILKSIPKDRVAPACSEIDLDASFEDLPTQRALGLKWHPPEDTLSVKVKIDLDKPFTRKGTLSFLASITDPVGFICPVILVGRQILQEACRRELTWDAELPDDLKTRWIMWKNGLPVLVNFKVQRCYAGFENVDAIANLQLHHFCDASDHGYGTASYLRVESTDGTVRTSLVQAKSRCKPLRHISIPRSETQAAVTAVRIDRFIQYELKLRFDDVVFWTDSTIVLQYIRNRNKRFRPFIANRLEEIHDTTEPHMWRYCNTKNNPADIASRGISGSKLLAKSQFWLEGPSFIKRPSTEWPLDPTLPDLAPDDPELSAKVYSIETEESTSISQFLQRYSTWEELVYKTVTLRKFTEYLKVKVKKSKQPFVPQITSIDRTAAIESIVRLVQMETYPAELEAVKSGKSIPKSSSVQKLLPFLSNQSLRVGGRVEHALLPFSTRHPLLLPKKHHVTNLIVRWAHAVVGHSGPNYTLAKIREAYWIPDGRAVVKAVISQCIICKRIQARPMEQKMAPLPSSRLAPLQPPFTVTGSDCFGPFMVRRGRSEVKRWGIIFCCFSTRAVHLEMLPDMTTSSLINALRRFTRRRANVRQIWSDNGSNLVGGSRELRRSILAWNKDAISAELLQRQIEWKFQTPYASHRSGVWERLVGMTKRSLKAILGNKLITDDALATTFCEVECIMNGRPITPASDDPNDLNALTPNQILVQHSINSLPPGLFDPSDDAYRKRWRQSQYLANIWWKRWMQEYLPLLQATKKWTRERRNAAIGDLVLVADDTKTRGHWPLGRIIQTYPGIDNLVRTVDVKTASGVYRRPITKLYLLEGAQ